MKASLAASPREFAPAGCRPASAVRTVLVLGVGDPRRGDEGAGIHVVRALRREPALGNVQLLECPEPGANLLPKLEGVSALVLATVTRDGQAAGTIRYSQPNDVDDLPPALAPPLEGLRELFSAAVLLRRLPPTHLYTISLGETAERTAALSPAIAVAVATATWIVHGHAAELTTRGSRPA